MTAERSPGERNVIHSLWTLAGVPIGIVVSTLWAVVVDTSPTLSDEERIRGWGTVVRELPASLVLLAVVGVGFALAVRGGRKGAVASARRAIWLHGATLMFVLLVIVGGSTENVMTTRPSTVKWLLLPVQIGVVVLAVSFARRTMTRGVRS